MNTNTLIILLTYFFAFTHPINALQTAKKVSYYQRNPLVSEETWNAALPYLLPEDSREKNILDRIFSKRRVLKSRESMEKSGFFLLGPPERVVMIAKHQQLKGYILKCYLDTYYNGSYSLIRRAMGAKAIQDIIDSEGFENILCVPKKWVYPLPIDPGSSPDEPRQTFIVLCEKINILDGQDNIKAYKKKFTPTMANALYTVLSRLIMIDSMLIDNIPFCKDGRIAFIDTEHFHGPYEPPPSSRYMSFYNPAQLSTRLSPKMQEYWQQLISH